MPLPKPRQGEKQLDFIDRCIPVAKKEFKDKQAIAVCYNIWSKK